MSSKNVIRLFSVPLDFIFKQTFSQGDSHWEAVEVFGHPAALWTGWGKDFTTWHFHMNSDEELDLWNSWACPTCSSPSLPTQPMTINIHPGLHQEPWSHCLFLSSFHLCSNPPASPISSIFRMYLGPTSCHHFCYYHPLLSHQHLLPGPVEKSQGNDLSLHWPSYFLKILFPCLAMVIIFKWS